MAPGMMIVKNNTNVSHWTLNGGYEEDDLDEYDFNKEYPLRVIGSGRSAGLDLSLQLDDRDYDFICKGYDQGFIVALTMPGETLKMSSNSWRVPTLENTLITIQPKITVTSKGLLNYRPDQRQCFFALERQLRFFKMYTQSNCEVECLSNYTKRECKCVKFSMPSKNCFITIHSNIETASMTSVLR